MSILIAGFIKKKLIPITLRNIVKIPGKNPPYVDDNITGIINSIKSVPVPGKKLINNPIKKVIEVVIKEKK